MGTWPTAHTFPLDFSRPSMVKWLPDSQLLPKSRKTYTGSIFLQMLLSLGIPWNNLVVSSPLSFVLHLNGTIPKSSFIAQNHPFPLSLTTSKLIAPSQRLNWLYLSRLTPSCFFSPMVPFPLQFVGVLTTPFLFPRRHRWSPDGFSFCLPKRGFIPNSFNFWSILPLRFCTLQRIQYFPDRIPTTTYDIAYIWYSHWQRADLDWHLPFLMTCSSHRNSDLSFNDSCYCAAPENPAWGQWGSEKGSTVQERLVYESSLLNYKCHQILFRYII